MLKIAIFASGSGSNFENLVNNAKNYEVSFLFCDRKDAYVIERAKKLSINYRYTSIIKEKDNFEEKVLEHLDEFDVDIIVLAGYMKLIGKKILDKWEGKIINIHPSLLPKYPGKDAIKQAYNNGEKTYGITIHYVDEGMDTGPIIQQESFVINDQLSLDEVTQRVHELEHTIYPKVINRIGETWKNI